MPGGRRPLYRPAYCDAVAGFRTITAFARHIGVATSTLYRWTDTYPEFAEATKTMTRHHPGLLYRDEYCDEVVDFLKDGYSLAAFAGHIGVSREALYRWIKTQPLFAEAAKRAQAKSILWWERRILELAQTGQGNAAAITLGLKNRAPEEWRDKTHTELSGTVERIHRIERVIARPGASEPCETEPTASSSHHRTEGSLADAPAPHFNEMGRRKMPLPR